MNKSSRYFVFIYPSKSDIRDYLNLAVYALSPNEKWPAHITVAGPFAKLPRARAEAKFDATIFSFGVWNFFSQGINTVYLKVGVPDIRRYWLKPSFATNPVPHITLYNGDDAEYARLVFERLSKLKLEFSFRAQGISVVNSSAQRPMDLREQVNVSCLPRTRDLNVDDLRKLTPEERLEIAVDALSACLTSSKNSGSFKTGIFSNVNGLKKD
ncbi:2'-5' RNA ligase family protein [Sphingorhabdus sp.]|jgi:hypothetical protein|uniref:2'-5' RNA ligase family protein n=1 Tax=Sphingorhabdus sp. TaxID=1902408 RepID=UPI002C5FCCDF|nr:2'-5' RNA ligase family protein [Sphingorhabdus sp.]HMT42838.1 2'-5' RNA ligase family protein [Sphingorhabdus sp.]